MSSVIYGSGSPNLSDFPPGVIVDVQPPQPNGIQGLETNTVRAVGTGSFGPVNQVVPVQDYASSAQAFGAATTDPNDISSFIYLAQAKGANNFLCVRVTDGTDLHATANLLDTATPSVTGIILSCIYSGTTGNQITATVSAGSNSTNSVPTYRVSVSLPGVLAENFDNIGGTGPTLWANIAAAINNGQSQQDGPSQLVTATVFNGLGQLIVTSAGTGFTAIPTIGFTGGGGTGATASAIMKALVAGIQAGGTGYNVGDTITLAGGTSTQAIVLTVATVSTGTVTGVTITTAGKYSVLPSNPLSQASTSGTGTGATFNITSWGVDSLSITAAGTNFTSAPTVTFTGGGGTGAAATAFVGAQAAPNKTTYTMSGGTNGNSGVNTASLLGTDTTPPTGMYCLRNSGIGTMALIGCTDTSSFGAQSTFGLQEGNYIIGSGPISQTVAQAITALQGAAVETSAFKYMVGDWEYWLDTVNNVYRYSTQQAAACALYSTLPPPQGGLNQALNLTVTMSTQRSVANKPYSDQEIIQLQNAGIDVIAAPSPGGNYFAMKTGLNSAAPLNNTIQGSDSYSRLTPYLAFSLKAGLGQFVGQPLTGDEEKVVYFVITNFLQQLANPPYKWIGDVNGGKAFSVSISAQGTTLIANVYVVMFNTIVNILVNLYNGETQISNPVPNTTANRKRFKLI